MKFTKLYDDSIFKPSFARNFIVLLLHVFDSMKSCDLEK